MLIMRLVSRSANRVSEEPACSNADQKKMVALQKVFIVVMGFVAFLMIFEQFVYRYVVSSTITYNASLGYRFGPALKRDEADPLTWRLGVCAAIAVNVPATRFTV